ncbi:hypothetical protein Lal_00019886 [Lupinus albus]|nr:hypothetical protein Lal_00019886 [Lupinus albus]
MTLNQLHWDHNVTHERVSVEENENSVMDRESEKVNYASHGHMKEDPENQEVRMGSHIRRENTKWHDYVMSRGSVKFLQCLQEKNSQLKGLRVLQLKILDDILELKYQNIENNIKCKPCGKVIKGDITRLKQHIAHYKEQVETCPKVTSVVREIMMKLLLDGKEKIDSKKRKDEFKHN